MSTQIGYFFLKILNLGTPNLSELLGIIQTTLSNGNACNRFAVQALLLVLKLAIDQNLGYNTITASNLASAKILEYAFLY